MKDKLRELAEMVREAYRAGFIAACKWPEPVSQDVDSSAYNKEFNAWSFSVREKHAAILDAEGDGVAVACEMCKKLHGQIDALHTVLDIRERRVARTHPARSGVVSDKDVEAACAIYFGGRHWPHGVEEVELVRISMRAALESFARRTP